MNVGQILETHLGWAAHGLGKKIGEMLDQRRDVVMIRGSRKYIQPKRAKKTSKHRMTK